MTNYEKILEEWADETEGLGPNPWCDGQRSVKIEPTGNPDSPWVLWLSETKEYGTDSADWTTRDWSFYGNSIADVVRAAIKNGPLSAVTVDVAELRRIREVNLARWTEDVEELHETQPDPTQMNPAFRSLFVAYSKKKDDIEELQNALGDALDEIWEHRKKANPDANRLGLETLTVPGWLKGDRDALL